MLDQITELKSAEVIDTPEGVERFLAELKNAVSENGDTSVMQTADGRLCVTKQNPATAMSDPMSAPSRERIQQMVAERGMPWDEKYAERVIPWWASDERVDRQGDIVLQNWKFDDYQNNPLMLYAHRWDDPPIGTVLNWEVMPRTSRVYNGRSLRLMPLFATKDQYEWADTIFRLAKARFLRTGSVGFYSDNIIQVRDPNERMRMGLGNMGVIYDRNNLIEWTVAPVPANQGALQSLSLVASKGLLKGDDLPVVTDIFKSSVKRGAGDAEKIRDIEKAVGNYWNRLFPATKTVSTVDTKSLPQSYREADGSQRCENCASYEPDSTDEKMGVCRQYSATCRANMTCNSWKAKMPVEITKEGVAVAVPAPAVAPVASMPVADSGSSISGTTSGGRTPQGGGSSPVDNQRPEAVPQRWDDAMDFIKSRYEDHQAAVGNDPRKQTTEGKLQQVFARGVNAWDDATEEQRGGLIGEDWGYARVESFLNALQSLRFEGEPHDQDLLPAEHPKSEREKVNKAVVGYINRGMNRFIKGDFVSWRTKGGMAVGQIEQIDMKGMVATDSEEMEAMPEDPVATINPIVEQEGKKMGCGKPRLMPFSRIKMAPNQFPEPSNWRCMDSQRKRIGDMVMSHNKEVGNDPIRLASAGTAVHVFERGMGSYLEDRRGISDAGSVEQYAEARLASYLDALRRGGFQGDSHDEDLLPQDIAGSRRAQAIKVMVARAAAYEGIDFAPPEGARTEAQRGLDWRREYGRGGTEIGVARARDIANGKNLSPETVRRMNSYFARHEVDKKGEGFNPDESGYPSAGRIAWALWGGDAAMGWAAKVMRQMEARQTKMFEPIGVVGGLRGRMNDASDRYQEIYRWVKTADPEMVKKAVDGIGVRTDVDYSTLWQDEPKAKFVSSVLLAAEIGGDPRDPNETLKFVRGCVSKAIRRRAVEQITKAAAKRTSELDSLASALKEFDESKIDRDENGRFSGGGGGGGGGGDDSEDSKGGSGSESIASMKDGAKDALKTIGEDNLMADGVISSTQARVTGAIDMVDAELDDEREALEARISDYGGDDEAGLRESLKDEFDSIADQRSLVNGTREMHESLREANSAASEQVSAVFGEAQQALRSARLASSPEQFNERVAGQAERLVRVLDEASSRFDGAMKQAVSRLDSRKYGSKIPKERRATLENARKAAIRLALVQQSKREMMRESLLRGMRSPLHSEENYTNAYARVAASWGRMD